MSRPTAGAALVSVVLITLALYAIGHGLLALSLGELAASRAGVRQLESRTAAESAIHAVLAGPGAPWMDSVGLGERRRIGGRAFGRAEGVLDVRRLSREAWWLEGVGTVGAARSRTVRLAWALDPVERVLALDAALTVGADAPVALAGEMDVSAPLTVAPSVVPADCDPWRAELDARYATRPLGAVARLPSGDSIPRLGLLDLPDLLARAPVQVSGSSSPEPVEAFGRCDEMAPWSWGDPERPWRPCGNALVLRGAAGDLDVAGGAGQGVLVVDGALTLRDGARFYGIALVGGELVVEDGGRLVGMAVAAGGVRVGPGGAVQGSACWAARALAARRIDLGGFLPIPGVGPLGTF